MIMMNFTIKLTTAKKILSDHSLKSVFVGFFLFYCFSFSLAQVSLLKPFNEYVTIDDNIEFRWNSISSADHYELSYSEFEDFAGANELQLIETQFNVTLPLGKYFWRVRYFESQTGYSEWSSIRNFTVIDIAAIGSLGLWLRADELVTADASNRVSSWGSTGSAYNLTQATASLQPELVNNSINGYPSLYFDGTRQIGNANLLSIGTFFAFYRHSNANNFILSGLNGPTANPRFVLSQVSDNINTTNSTLFNASEIQVFNSTVDVVPINKWAIVNGKRTSAAVDFANFQISSTHSGYLRFVGNVSEMIVFSNLLTPTAVNDVAGYLRFKYSPPAYLGENDNIDYGFCEKVLSPGLFEGYLWSDNSTGPQLLVSETGIYSVQVVDMFGLVSNDLVEISYPTISQPNSTLFCPGSSVTWNANLGPHYTYAWSTGETTESIVIDTPGSYYVTVTDTNGCSKTFPAIDFEEDAYSTTVSLGPDVDLCNGNAISLVSGEAETVSYLWNTGASGSSIVVSTSGTYSVTTTNANGCEAYDEVQVTIVGDAPVVSIGMQPAYCQGLGFTYTDNSVTTDGSSIVSRNWQFGDGGVSALASGNYAYVNHGAVTVTLTVETSAGCGNSAQLPVVVHQKPIVSFTNLGQCQDAPVQFAGDQSSLPMMSSWNWNFGDPASGAANTATGQLANHTFDAPGSYAVELIAIDVNGCRDTLVQSVAILPAPQVDFTFDEVCQGQTVNFVNQTTLASPFLISGVNWNLGVATSTNFNPSRLYSTAGFFNIVLTVTANNGCVGQHTEQMQVHALPQPDYVVSAACAGLPVSFTDASVVPNGAVGNVFWQFGATSPQSGLEIERTFPNAGTVQLTQTVQSAFGCQASEVSQVTVNPGINANFTHAQDIVLAGVESVFTAVAELGGSVYTWSIAGAELGSGGVFSLTPDESAIGDTLWLTLTVENEFGCISSTTQSFPIYEARTDLAVSQLFVQNQNGFQVIGAELTNKGSTTLTRIDLFVRSSNAPVFKETWQGELRAGEKEVYVFQSQPAADVNEDKAAERYLCVEGRIVLPAGSPDEDLTNNEVCRNLGEAGIVLMAPYPNPATTSLTLQVIFPEAAEAELWIADASGRIVARVVEGDTLPKGLSSFTLDVSLWAGGTYTVVLKSGDEVRRVRVVKG